MFRNFLFLQSGVVFGIVNAFPWIFDTASSEKSSPTSMLFLLIYIEFRTIKFFARAEYWLVNSNKAPPVCWEALILIYSLGG